MFDSLKSPKGSVVAKHLNTRPATVLFENYFAAVHFRFCLFLTRTEFFCDFHSPDVAEFATLIYNHPFSSAARFALATMGEPLAVFE
jgi:hypothetical protein